MLKGRKGIGRKNEVKLKETERRKRELKRKKRKGKNKRVGFRKLEEIIWGRFLAQTNGNINLKRIYDSCNPLHFITTFHYLFLFSFLFFLNV